MSFTLVTIIWLIAVFSLLGLLWRQAVAAAAKRKRLSGILRLAIGREQAATYNANYRAAVPPSARRFWRSASASMPSCE